MIDPWRFAQAWLLEECSMGSLIDDDWLRVDGAWELMAHGGLADGYWT